MNIRLDTGNQKFMKWVVADERKDKCNKPIERFECAIENLVVIVNGIGNSDSKNWIGYNRRDLDEVAWAMLAES